MQIQIDDDFDLDKIIDSGQCFRGIRIDSHKYRFMTGDKILYLQREKMDVYTVSCNEAEWENVWKSFFDLDRSYCGLAASETGKNSFVDSAIAYGRGLRLLRQDPWEMLVTFIISQRKSIPAITKSVEAISDRFGHNVITKNEKLKAFPSAEEMKYATEQDLAECGLGYRIKYVLDAIKQANSGNLNLKTIANLPDNLLLEELQKVYGVGEKVANCIALFAYGRTGCIPVDIWISRAIENECAGISPFYLYGNNAGIIQQYVFYYERNVISHKC